MALYSSRSFYSRTGQDGWALGYYVNRPITPDSTDQLVIIEPKYENNPMALSYDLYGTQDYWWTIYKLNMNSIKDPLRDFKQGLVIRVVHPSRIKTVG